MKEGVFLEAFGSWQEMDTGRILGQALFGVWETDSRSPGMKLVQNRVRSRRHCSTLGSSSVG